MFSNFPTDFGFSFAAIAVWQREAEERADDNATAAPDPADCGPASEEPAMTAPEEPDFRWVFKGYEWQPVARWVPVLDPAWDQITESDPDDLREREIRHERERQQTQQSAISRQHLGTDGAGTAQSDEAERLNHETQRNPR